MNAIRNCICFLTVLFVSGLAGSQPPALTDSDRVLVRRVMEEFGVSEQAAMQLFMINNGAVIREIFQPPLETETLAVCRTSGADSHFGLDDEITMTRLPNGIVRLEHFPASGSDADKITGPGGSHIQMNPVIITRTDPTEFVPVAEFDAVVPQHVDPNDPQGGLTDVLHEKFRMRRIIRITDPIPGVGCQTKKGAEEVVIYGSTHDSGGNHGGTAHFHSTD